MGLVKVAVAIAIEDYLERPKKMLDIAAVTVLCNRIPDLFDYVCDEKTITSHMVSQIRINPYMLENVYGFFDRYGCFSGELVEISSENIREIFDDLWNGLKDDDLIYLIEVHV